MTTNQIPAPQVDYHNLPTDELLKLGTPDLIKFVNEEYGVILVAERRNYPKAIVIGQVLIQLRKREEIKH
jgi:hypothetical protein